MERFLFMILDVFCILYILIAFLMVIKEIVIPLINLIIKFIKRGKKLTHSEKIEGKLYIYNSDVFRVIATDVGNCRDKRECQNCLYCSAFFSGKALKTGKIFPGTIKDLYKKAEPYKNNIRKIK